MNVEQIVSFLTALHAKNIKVKSNGWVESSCILAPWTHQKGIDVNPSFGVNIKPGEKSHFYCFSCRSGSLEELVQTLEFYDKDHLNQYNLATCHLLLNDELSVLPLPEYSEFKHTEQVFEEWPMYWLDSFQEVFYFLVAMSYLMGRNVPASIAQKFGLRFDPKRQMILCPYYNVFGKFAGARGRSVLDDTTGAKKHFDYTWQGKNNAKLCWYNEQVLNLPGPVVVVEGAFDCWRVSQSFAKVVANLSANPWWEKMKKLGDCSKVIQIPDRDKAGEGSVQVYSRMCKKLGVKHEVLILGEGVKDPDQCHPDYLKDRIEELL